MPADRIAVLFAFPPLAGRHVVAAFDGGTITSDASALLFGATDRGIGLTRRFAASFRDDRTAEYIGTPSRPW